MEPKHKFSLSYFLIAFFILLKVVANKLLEKEVIGGEEFKDLMVTVREKK